MLEVNDSNVKLLRENLSSKINKDLNTLFSAYEKVIYDFQTKHEEILTTKEEEIKKLKNSVPIVNTSEQHKCKCNGKCSNTKSESFAVIEFTGGKNKNSPSGYWSYQITYNGEVIKQHGILNNVKVSNFRAYALNEALKELNKLGEHISCYIKTDCVLITNNLCKYMYVYEVNNWKDNRNNDIADTNIWKSIFQLMSTRVFKIQFCKTIIETEND